MGYLEEKVKKICHDSRASVWGHFKVARGGNMSEVGWRGRRRHRASSRRHLQVEQSLRTMRSTWICVMGGCMARCHISAAIACLLAIFGWDALVRLVEQ